METAPTIPIWFIVTLTTTVPAGPKVTAGRCVVPCTYLLSTFTLAETETRPFERAGWTAVLAADEDAGEEDVAAALGAAAGLP